jgi:hypothetical protein
MGYSWEYSITIQLVELKEEVVIIMVILIVGY